MEKKLLEIFFSGKKPVWMTWSSIFNEWYDFIANASYDEFFPHFSFYSSLSFWPLCSWNESNCEYRNIMCAILVVIMNETYKEIIERCEKNSNQFPTNQIQCGN